MRVGQGLKAFSVHLGLPGGNEVYSLTAKPRVRLSFYHVRTTWLACLWTGDRLCSVQRSMLSAHDPWIQMLSMLLSCIQPSELAHDSAEEAQALPSDPIEGIDPSALPQSETPCREPVLVDVNYVVDGDTFFAQTPSREEKIRVIGINTPEVGYQGDPSDCLADEAWTRADELLSGRKVWLTFDLECEDYYGRTLAYVHLGEGETDFFERIMLQEGMAQAFPFDTTPTFIGLFAEDESLAQNSGIGGWSACGWQ
jgi:endonuclease YncB( thermonuclease family)